MTSAQWCYQNALISSFMIPFCSLNACEGDKEWEVDSSTSPTDVAQLLGMCTQPTADRDSSPQSPLVNISSFIFDQFLAFTYGSLAKPAVFFF
jgi:hypothetical protein